jgi:hypothetical protein
MDRRPAHADHDEIARIEAALDETPRTAASMFATAISTMLTQR